MLSHEKLICWELLDTSDTNLVKVRKLYEATQAPEERIPWEWLERSVARRASWQPGRWRPHLLVTAVGQGPINGFAYGGHIPGYGGYLSYLGVDPNARRLGVGTKLLDEFCRAVANDAAAEGSPLPFVVWESHRPDVDAPQAAWELWTARLRLFARAGAYWVEGLDFHSPDFEGDEDSIPLQLFIKPIDSPVESFDAERLKAVAAGLHAGIYRHGPEHPLVRATLPPGCKPRLRPPLMGDRRVAMAG